MKKTSFLAATLAMTLCACVTPDKTDTPKGTSIEYTDAGTKISEDINQRTLRVVKKIKTTCGTEKYINEISEFDCPKLLKKYKNPDSPGEICIKCEHEKDVLE